MKTSQLIVIWYAVILIVVATVAEFESFWGFVASVVMVAAVTLYSLRDHPDVDKKLVVRWVGSLLLAIILLTMAALFAY